MLALLSVLLVPVLVGGAIYLHVKAQEQQQSQRRWYTRTITVREFLLMEVIALVAAVGGFFLVRYAALQDIEHWNGRITGKPSGSQSCCHCRQECDTCTDSDGKSYSCNCVEVCDHDEDYWWSLTVSTGDELSIDSCEPNPRAVPRAWIDAYVGEPAAVEHRFTNYLKADPESLLLRPVDPALMARVPEFPEVRNHYKVNKVLGVGVTPPGDWQTGLRELNADLGASKQVDIALIFTDAPPEFADAVERKWVYGPKNALIVVAGVTPQQTLGWVRVVTISRVEGLKVRLRDELTGLPLVDHAGGLKRLREAVEQEFQRTPMAEFEYLASAATPPWYWMLGLYAIVGVVTALLAVLMKEKDVL